MLTFSLQSGSNGNCIYVEAGETRLLFDAGITGKQAQARMAVHKRELHGIDALIISHDHADHIRCCGVFHRKFNIPVWMTSVTQTATRCDLGKLERVNYFTSGQTLAIKDVLVHTLRTPHDGADGVAFVVEHGGKRLGILTDLGHPFNGLRELIPTLDAVYLESNYDPHMLRNGPYAWYLQERIRGKGGHLSNQESAELLRSAGRRLQWAALAHLSAENNTPALAMETHRQVVGRMLPLMLASRERCSDMMTL
ncbi:MAG TPA: MBL fold metallo-hydrolase [Phycisphaerae bacterium]|nr:MBL fold metallo-hydrolase [Phycisphaerae bacterium]HOJ74756.1 MBL fold metallo-hydrolase [Phycisphaerae bacterium]HOM52125.1 MBL fold metallo-hydrolase [Phycisphaerae bacterium]HON65907.1 MBL fold metallo-hydrolase [Phycisphaerae bacterium]HOQ85905.1 MBL fold metallo-hydrolase [Phycisphaerae bacterium]